MQQHSLLCYGGIMSKRFKLYNVNIKYIRNLHNVDDNVPSVSPQIGKQARPFLGIVVLINGSKFCIPFTSNSGKKNKNFESMSENITFLSLFIILLTFLDVVYNRSSIIFHIHKCTKVSAIFLAIAFIIAFLAIWVTIAIAPILKSILV